MEDRSTPRNKNRDGVQRTNSEICCEGESTSLDDETLLLQHRNLDESLHYEELINPSRDSVTCKTCHGLGRVPRERTNELIALVPYNDERLKPKRTKCVVMSAISVLFIMFLVAAIFATPRSVSFDERGSPYKKNATVDEKGSELKLDLAAYYGVENNNYYPIQIISLDMKIMYGSYIVKNVTMAMPTSSDMVHARDGINMTVNVYDIFFGKANHLGFLVNHCVQPYRRFNSIALQFQTTANITYWYGHFELLQKVSSHFVRCESTNIEHQIDHSSTMASELLINHET